MSLISLNKIVTDTPDGYGTYQVYKRFLQESSIEDEPPPNGKLTEIFASRLDLLNSAVDRQTTYILSDLLSKGYDFSRLLEQTKLYVEELSEILETKPIPKGLTEKLSGSIAQMLVAMGEKMNQNPDSAKKLNELQTFTNFYEDQVVDLKLDYDKKLNAFLEKTYKTICGAVYSSSAISTTSKMINSPSIENARSEVNKIVKVALWPLRPSLPGNKTTPYSPNSY